MQFNKYEIYAVQNNLGNLSQDEVDELVQGVKITQGYNELKSYVEGHFGSFEGEKWVDYEDLHKAIYMKIDKDNVEFCALKNDNQYFGKGFKLVSKNNNL